MGDSKEKVCITWDDVNSAGVGATSPGAAPILSASPVRVVNGWLRLSAVKIASAVVVMSMLLGIFVFWRVGAARRNDPMTTIKVVDSISSESALVNSKDYFTPKGYGLTQWFISESRQSEVSALNVSFGSTEIIGDKCRVWGTLGDIRMAICLEKGDRWLFDDIYIASVNGRDVNLYATYIREHPVKTWFKANWPELLDGFMQGFIFGVSGG